MIRLRSRHKNDIMTIIRRRQHRKYARNFKLHKLFGEKSMYKKHFKSNHKPQDRGATATKEVVAAFPGMREVAIVLVP